MVSGALWEEASSWLSALHSRLHFKTLDENSLMSKSETRIFNSIPTKINIQIIIRILGLIFSSLKISVLRVENQNSTKAAYSIKIFTNNLKGSEKYQYNQKLQIVHICIQKATCCKKTSDIPKKKKRGKFHSNTKWKPKHRYKRIWKKK